jgi:hypothetical protein
MKPLGLTPQEKSDLVAFMKTLTSDFRQFKPKEYRMRLPTLAFAMLVGLSVGALVANLTITQEGYAQFGNLGNGLAPPAAG